MLLDPLKLWSDIEREQPEIAQLTYPRNYAVPGEFHSPKLLSMGMSMAIIGVLKGRSSQTGRTISGEPIITLDDMNTAHAYTVSLRLLEFMVPTFFVARDILKAAMATRLPTDIKIHDIKWPFPAMKFVFPRGMVSSPHDGEIPGLCIGNNETGELAFRGLPKMTSTSPGIGLFTIALENGCPLFANRLDTRDETANEWVTRVESMDAMLFAPEPKEAFGRAVGKDHPEYKLLKEEGGLTKTTEEDKAFLDDLTRLALKLILIMGARPQLVEQGTCTRPASSKKGREKKEIWSPNLIGRTYRLQRSDKPEPTGRTIVLHPVAGHTRMQWYGPRDRAVARPIWIEPTWSGSKSKDDQTK